MNLTGFRPLLTLALRRDRIKLPIWLLSISAMVLYLSNAIRWVYPDEAELNAIVGFMGGPAGTVLGGPGYGFERPTHAVVFAGVYALYLYLGAALMTVLLVIRHTRAEEEQGRLELVLAAPVGRHVPLAVAGTVMTGASMALGAVSTLVLLPTGYGAGAAVLVGANLAMVAFVFGAIAMVTAQLVEHSRTAAGLAIAALALALVVRGIGDVLRTGGSWLSWFSPLAWAQQTRPYHDERIWPLLLGVLFGTGLIVLATGLRARRDHGAGLLPPRTGRADAPAWLRSPFGLLLRLERNAILGWSLALTVLGGLYGTLAESVRTSLGDIDNDIMISALGGDPARLVDGYLATCVLFNAYVVLSYALVTIHRLVVEERDGRTELVLAGPVDRSRWLLAGFGVAVVGSVVMLTAAGFGMGSTAAIVTRDLSHLGAVIAGTMLYLPAITVMLGIALLGYSIRPRLLGAVWAFAVFAMVVGYLGFVLDLPDLVIDLSPLGHIARMPLETQEPLPLVVLLAITAVLTLTATTRFRRRDLVTGRT